MQVWPGRPPGGSLVTDQVPTCDDLAARNTAGIPGQVAVHGRVPVAVDHHDHVPVADRARIEVDDARVRRDERRVVWRCDVKARVLSMRVRTWRVGFLVIDSHAAVTLG